MSHMVTVKLSASNYLLWHSLIHPLFFSQKFLPYVDSSFPPPPKTVVDSSGSSAPNPAYTKWYANDQIVKVFFTSTLSVEALATVVGCSSSRDVWETLAAVYNCHSKPREFKIKDELQLMTKGSLTVTEFGAKIKGLCDQLAAMGHPIDGTDKSHWFLRGLGPDFIGFSSTQINKDPLPSFTDLFSLAESHELFTKVVHGNTSSPGNAAFAANHSKMGQSRGGGQHGRSNSNGNGGGRSFNFSNQGRGVAYILELIMMFNVCLSLLKAVATSIGL